MSEAIAFDTHKFVKHLTASGFTELQAEALANEHVTLLNSNLATKANIAAVKKEIEALRRETKANIALVQRDIEALRLATEAKIESSSASVLKWMIGAMIAQSGVIVTLIKLLQHSPCTSGLRCPNFRAHLNG